MLTAPSPLVVLILVARAFGDVEAGVVSNCTNSCTLETRETLRREQLMRELLAKLGLQQPPRIDAAPLAHMARASSQMAQIFGERVPADSSDSSIDSIPRHTTYVMGQKVIDDAVVFDFSETTKHRMPSDVHLHVYLRSPNSSNSVPVTVMVEERLKTGREGARLGERKFHRRVGQSGYVRVQLDPADLERWWENDAVGKGDLLGLHVTALDSARNNLAENVAVDAADIAMFMELEVRDDSGRQKRSASDSSCEKQHNQCCLYPLIVDFEAAGWDFVIAPKKYNAFMCNGECPLSQMVRYPHSKITGAQLKNVTGGLCCHPTEYDPLTLIYMTEQREVLVSKVTGMVARRCGCA